MVLVLGFMIEAISVSCFFLSSGHFLHGTSLVLSMPFITSHSVDWAVGCMDSGSDFMCVSLFLHDSNKRVTMSGFRQALWVRLCPGV